MSRGILSKVIEDIGEAQAEIRAEDYTMVNVRPGEKVAVMLELIAVLSGKTASAVVAEELSSRLAAYAASSVAHVDAIMDATERALKQSQMLQPGSALAILQKGGVLEVEDGFHEKLRNKMFSQEE
ncbi:hypothetical protein MUO32_08530 [Shinella sp. CPCC 101442]|uniref:hypothetical protein n=1 Tax=Shinella sp. CPCC 101442 TaxID=2932265 RepID=UPI002152A44A|nr:hypothetical protein [Shinella sp. CPCC 101442]MCR6499074.1 hypothetical protein [Shinella sp. CPCC 101442]